MNDDKKSKIESAAVDLLHKRQAVEGMSMLNVYGRNQEEREQMARDYAIAQALAFEAEATLLAVQKS